MDATFEEIAFIDRHMSRGVMQRLFGQVLGEVMWLKLKHHDALTFFVACDAGLRDRMARWARHSNHTN